MADGRAIVVGGAGGIGGAVCRKLASDGYSVVVADFNIERAEDIRASLDEGAGPHQALKIDITDEGSVSLAFDAVEADRPANILVIASGGPVVHLGQRVNVATMSMTDWKRTVDLNLTGVFCCVQKFAQQRIARPLEQSRIVIVGSSAGVSAGGGVDIGYVSSKAGVFGFTRQAAFDLARHNITVNVVSPGPVETAEFIRNTNEEIRAGMSSFIPLARLAGPDEVAASVGYLVSPEASYITGASLDINGGAHMR